MAKRQVFIDGFVQEIEEGDPLIRQENPGFEIETSQVSFDVAAKAYEQARKIKTLRDHPGYIELIRDLENQEEELANAWRACTVESRRDDLGKRQRDLRIILNYLRNVVEEAASVPRPILQQQ